MRLLFVADLHYSLKQFDWLKEHAADFDAVLIGGDLLDLSSALDADVQIAIVEKYLRFLRHGAPVAVSSGNHDGDSRNAADESVAAWIQDMRAEGMYVDGDSFDLGGARFTVCPWWDGSLSREQLQRQLEVEAAHPKSRWIWVHHAPPEGAKTCWTGRKFIGDESLRGWIERFQPDLVLSGHIHNAPFYAEGSWIDRIGKTWVFNPGRQIGPRPTTIVIDLDAWTAEWESIEGRSLQDLGVPQG
ncbi:MAG: metallophosphoesterase [Verrucomicrobiales bacterium]|nr:metallophosphoesterase [Verrucomicrobiales bacterium]